MIATLRLILALMVATASAFAYDVSGLVVDLQAKPVAGASVWLVQDRIPLRTETDTEGHFLFKDVAVGPVEIVAWKEGYAVGGRGAKVVGSAEIAIALGEPGTFTLRLISRAKNPETKGELPPEPVEGARIETMLVNDAFNVAVDDLTRLGFPSIRSDADGRMSIPYAPKGGYLAFRVGHRSFCDEHVHYPVGQREIAIQLYPGVVLRGRVTNEAGEGLERARVSVFRGDRKNLREVEEVTTNAEGFYTTMLPPGDYNVTAKHPGYAMCPPIAGTLLAASAEMVCDLKLPPAFAIHGRIIGSDEKPVGGVDVQYVFDDIIFEQTMTDSEGRFALRVAESEGRIHVEAPDGYMTDRGTDIEVKMGKSDVTLEEPIRLAVLPEITGTVTDEQGVPVPSALVSYPQADPPIFTRSDDAGRFAMRLARVPREAFAAFRIEHPLRFLRSDVTAPLTGLQPLAVSLAPFDPDLAPRDPATARNKDLAALVGKPAPELACDLWFNIPFDTGGKPLAPTLAELKGKVVVLSFWGGFDSSTEGKAHLDELNALHPIVSTMEDVALIGIHDTGNEEYEIDQYLIDNAIEYPVARDKDAATFDVYDVTIIPQTVLIDKKGVLRYSDTEGRLLELIKSLRREAP
ncbi:MAG: carboxypeptidase regulatory-like domain-containing protein [Candidatus Hydrogenedentes bacterium]|nr:carboxypeptidase regulatory-like domain-containing protein [Candidatus Hydrogenedentota bacterium]